MDIYLEELEKAIRLGDATVASELANILAEQKSNLSLQIKVPAVDLPEKKINVKIIIEDRFTSNVSITWSLLPSMKFAELKSLMFERLDFPPQIQKWLAGKRLVKDTDTLHGCGVRSDNDVVYLYLVSAKSVGLTRAATGDLERQQSRRSLQRNNNSSGSMAYTETCSAEFQGFMEELNPLQQGIASPPPVGWSCPKCTFINEPTRPGCAVCSTARPDEYVVPDDYELSINERHRIEQERMVEKEVLQQREFNFRKMVAAAEESSLINNPDAFMCPICFEKIDPRHGVILRECLHVFCRDCLQSHVRHAESSEIICPYSDGHYQCPNMIQDREIRALVTNEIYQKHLQLSLVEAESRSANSFHCQTPNCIGWCIYEDEVNTFNCPVCTKENCLTCKAIHEGISCRQYQDDVKVKARNDTAAKQTQEKIEAMLRKGDAMKCPTCDVIVMKKDGCDWIRCTMCKTEICWVTKGPRWGPLGSGDVTGGCKCGLNSKACHPNCQNCH